MIDELFEEFRKNKSVTIYQLKELGLIFLVDTDQETSDGTLYFLKEIDAIEIIHKRFAMDYYRLLGKHKMPLVDFSELFTEEDIALLHDLRAEGKRIGDHEFTYYNSYFFRETENNLTYDEQLKQAKTGDYRAQFSIAPSAVSERNNQEMYFWLEKSACQGYTPAMSVLAHFKWDDYRQKGAEDGEAARSAFSWFTKLALKGHNDEAGRLALRYLIGDGVEKNDNEFRFWREIARRQRSDGEDPPVIERYFSLLEKENRSAIPPKDPKEEFISQGIPCFFYGLLSFCIGIVILLSALKVEFLSFY